MTARGSRAEGALQGVLEELLRDTGAARAVWRPGEGAAVRVPARPGLVAEAAEPWEAELPTGTPGEALELGPRDCARRPVLRAAGIERAALLRVPLEPTRRDEPGEELGEPLLALAGDAGLTVGEGRLAGTARVLLELDQAERSRRTGERGERLTELGLGAAGTAHDLRNLLATALLEFQVAGDAADRERLGRTLEQAAALARDFLGGEVDRVRERVTLTPLVQREVRRAEAALGQPCELVGEPAADLCVAGRADLCGRALANLLSNAIEASPRGRGLVVSLSGTEEHVDLEVSDRGRGMDGERLRHLLEPGSSASGGTGFGTASVLVCLARMGGELSLDSRPGEGTTARMRLRRFPLGDAVLVADDDDASRDARSLAIRASGGRAIGAADVREASAWLEGGGVKRLLVARGLPGRRELLELAGRLGLESRVASATRR